MIGYSAMTLTNPFFQVISESMSTEAAKHGYEIAVLSADDDSVKQSSQLDNFVVQGVLCNRSPIQSTPKRLARRFARANEAGIPVFTNDSAHKGSQGEVVCNIMTDNFQGGRLAGEALIKAVGDRGGEVAILHKPKAESCQQRVAGFKEVIEEHNAKAADKKLEIVAELDGDGATALGEAVARDMIEAHPRLLAIFAINDPSAHGAYTALKAAGKTEQVTLIGFDGQQSGKAAIRRGEILCDPIQFPDKIGTKTIEQIMAHFAGDEVPKEILIPSRLYYKEDAIKELGEIDATVPPPVPDNFSTGPATGKE